ncbi:MAG: peptidoglycan-associated lipoprotein Pal [Sphingobium sp.]|nr:peptidoglycan-associated lipoprotein Pal [Sphingobium sp.]
MRKTPILLLVTSAALALSACAKKAPPELPKPPQDTAPTPTPTPPPPTPTPAGPRPGSQADFIASVTSDRIFFDTDKSDVDDADKGTLQSQAAWLQKYPQVRVTIEGHADERGTREYNLALGERRANAAKNYLASLGIDAGRLTVISYGKERPDALGSDEASWAKNRRAVSVVVE